MCFATSNYILCNLRPWVLPAFWRTFQRLLERATRLEVECSKRVYFFANVSWIFIGESYPLGLYRINYSLAGVKILCSIIPSFSSYFSLIGLSEQNFPSRGCFATTNHIKDGGSCYHVLGYNATDAYMCAYLLQLGNEFSASLKKQA